MNSREDWIAHEVPWSPLLDGEEYFGSPELFGDQQEYVNQDAACHEVSPCQHQELHLSVHAPVVPASGGHLRRRDCPYGGRGSDDDDRGG